ncbi:MAG: polyphosphate kinase 2 [Planctomycetes bacterium]|nr:polyphosphate kinase 2 [Planctomycetota bacterium]
MSADQQTKRARYERALRALQLELVKLQRDVIAKGRKLLVIVEGRDAAGKDGLIKTLTEHLSPRDTRIFAAAKPSERERSLWYFQRWVPQLPAAGEIVFFNRSWYNRAGVERVMGFCDDEELREFLEDVPRFERMLQRAEIELVKYFLDVSKDEQAERFAERRRDPLKQWKISPIDATAQKRWKDYSKARDEMLVRTSSAHAPWIVVRADKKKRARLAVARDLLSRCAYKGKKKSRTKPDRELVFRFVPAALEDGRLAR